ncbi:MAG TPA: hypothetical protein VI076_00910 [Actinopolymorphaceae bacterium]
MSFELAALGWPTLVGLAVLGLMAGIGITAIGPGGVLATIGLFLLTDAPPETVAGTAIVTHVATGLLGTAAYLHSGELRLPPARRIVPILLAGAVVGTPLGVLANAVVSSQQFGLLLGGFCAAVAVVICAGIGVGVAAVSGMFGLGGPMVAGFGLVSADQTGCSAR